MAEFDIDAILSDRTRRQAARYAAAMEELIVATATRNRVAAAAARAELGEVIRDSMGSAEILGALSTYRVAAREKAATVMATDRYGLVAFANTTAEKILHRTPFEDAIEDLVDRVPVTLRNAAERTAANIARLYGESPVVAFAKSAESAVTEVARDLITKAMREGIPEQQIGKSLKFGVDRIRKETAAWTEGYARMAFRTNLNTAVTAGRFRSTQDPDIELVVPAFRFSAVGDSDTRSNHDAADGVILSVRNQAWRYLAPPLGYNCRCQVDHVTRSELMRLGRIDRNGKVIESKVPSSARPDDGFRHGGRPDLFINSGGR